MKRSRFRDEQIIAILKGQVSIAMIQDIGKDVKSSGLKRFSKDMIKTHDCKAYLKREKKKS